MRISARTLTAISAEGVGADVEAEGGVNRSELFAGEALGLHLVEDLENLAADADHAEVAESASLQRGGENLAIDVIVAATVARAQERLARGLQATLGGYRS